MSRILRRPMFRGGQVIDSRGTGITSGLMDGGRVGYSTGDLVTGKKLLNRYNYFDPNALPGFSSVKRVQAIPGANVSAEKGGQQIGDTDYLVTKGYASDVEKPVEDMSMAELLDFYAGEKSDTYQTGKSGLTKKITGMTEDGKLITEIGDFRPREIKSIDDLTETEKLDFRTKQMKAKKGATEKTPTIPIITEKKEEIQIDPNDPNSNKEQVTEVDAKTLMRENAELFKELLGGANEKKLKDARIQDASDYLLKFFEGSQKEGATVGSSAADVAAFATSRDSRVDKAKAAIDKQDQTAMAIAINDYIAGKRSKEQIDLMREKLGADFDLKLKIIDYQNKKRSFVDEVGELGKGMSNPKAIAGAVQKFFGKTPYALNEKQSGANLAADKENLGKYFVLSDGTVKTVIQDVDGNLIEDIVYSPSGITIEE